MTEVARATRYARALTVVVAEAEGVLELSDAWGVNAARHALREAAQSLRRLTRTSDYAMRIGVTRFGLILTETDEIAAINLVERARELVPSALPRIGEGIRLSFGWASPLAGDSADTLVRRADARLMEDLLRK